MATEGKSLSSCEFNLSNFELSLIPKGAFVVHYQAVVSDVIITRDGCVVQKEVMGIPDGFYAVDMSEAYSTPRLVTYETDRYLYWSLLVYKLGYPKDDIRVIRGANIKG